MKHPFSRLSLPFRSLRRGKRPEFTTVPYVPMSHETLLLEVSLTNRTNKVVGNFMLDTGWPYSSITDRCAASLGLIDLPASAAEENAGRRTRPEPESVLVSHFQCGDLDLGAVSLVVREEKHFRSLIPERLLPHIKYRLSAQKGTICCSNRC